MEPHYKDNWLTLYVCDVLDGLRELPDCSVHCCVTSPPYWGLRDYGVAGQIGLERTPEEYVAKMVEVFREVRRVLRDDGTLWLNLGDSYWANQYTENRQESLKTSTDTDGVYSRRIKRNTGIQHKRESGTLKPKDLVGIPWMVAFALRADGWYLRSEIIWHKPNPMPESVTDRPTKSHEQIFLLSKNASYYYDAEAIKEPSEYAGELKHNNGNDGMCQGYDGHRTREGLRRGIVIPPTRNKRTVWTVPSQPYPESHFATYPEDLIKPCILAGTSARGCCPKCGAPWGRVVESSPMEIDRIKRTHELGRTRSSGTMTKPPETKTIGWQPTCSCDDPINPNPFNPIPCTVLDPFGGSGTTGKVALERGRKAILIELNPDSGVLIMSRTHVTPALNLA